jgi:hypothetical protein
VVADVAVDVMQSPEAITIGCWDQAAALEAELVVRWDAEVAANVTRVVPAALSRYRMLTMGVGMAV